ncbi:hypothetical protein GCM10007881_49780 [Mesorhizobium huakuii]|nr:hypothetical protein GCM10007881_49780 [Mesorhizobium huakuii]
MVRFALDRYGILNVPIGAYSIFYGSMELPARQGQDPHRALSARSAAGLFAAREQAPIRGAAVAVIAEQLSGK